MPGRFKAFAILSLAMHVMAVISTLALRALLDSCRQRLAPAAPPTLRPEPPGLRAFRALFKEGDGP
jgi:hypothetical protein